MEPTYIRLLPETLEGGRATEFNNDLVFANGSFVVWPEGAQQ